MDENSTQDMGEAPETSDMPSDVPAVEPTPDVEAAAPVMSPPETPAPPAQPYAPPQVPSGAPVSGSKDRTTAGVLAILLGSLGVHKFYLGYTTEGIILLALTLVGSIIVVGPAVAAIIGLVEGIMYLTKSDQEFQAMYVSGRKKWF